MTNWKLLLSDNHASSTIEKFAFSGASVKDVERTLAFTPLAGEFRQLVRSRGANEARMLARKALRRRTA